MRPILSWCAAILLLVSLERAPGAALEASFHSGLARLAANGLELRDCKPGAVITVNQIHLPILAAGKPKLVAENRVLTFLGPGLEQKYQWETARRLRLVWTITTLDSGDGVTLKTTIYNGSGETARLWELAMIEGAPESLRFSDSGSNWVLSALSDGGQAGPLAGQGERWASDYMGLYRVRDSAGVAFGAVGKPEALVRYRVELSKGGDSLRAASEMSNVELAPGSWRDSQEIAILARPYRAGMTSLLQWAASTHGARARRVLRAGIDARPVDLDVSDAAAIPSDPGKTRFQSVRAYAQARRDALGEGAFLRAGPGADRSALGIADACLTAPGGSAQWRTPDNRGALDRILALGNAAPLNGVCFALDLGAASPDPNGGLTREELQTWLSFAGLAGGWLRVEDSQTRAANLSWDPDILAAPAPEKGWSFNGATDRNHQRFGFVARRAFGDFASMAVWNPLEAPADAGIGREGLSEIGARFHIWSFWDERYHGVGGADYVLKGLPAHGCKLLRLTPVSSDTNAPSLIGSTLHATMGAAEISDFGSDSKSVWIKLNGAGARQGKLFLLHRKALQLGAAENCVVDSVRERSTGLWEIAISARDRSREQRIALSVIE